MFVAIQMSYNRRRFDYVGTENGSGFPLCLLRDYDSQGSHVILGGYIP